MKRIDLRRLDAFGLDETACRRGHRYVTVFIDLAREERPVVFATEGKGKETVKRFRDHLRSHGGHPERVLEVVSDMTLVLAGAHLPRLEPPGSLLRRLATIWGLVCLTALYCALYLLFVPRRRPVRVLCGLSAGLAVAAYGVGIFFVEELADPVRYHLVYGSIGKVVLFLLWLDYHACLLVWGAWFLRLWQRDHPIRPTHRRFALARVLPWPRRRAEKGNPADGRGKDVSPIP